MASRMIAMMRRFARAGQSFSQRNAGCFPKFCLDLCLCLPFASLSIRRKARGNQADIQTDAQTNRSFSHQFVWSDRRSRPIPAPCVVGASFLLGQFMLGHFPDGSGQFYHTLFLSASTLSTTTGCCNSIKQLWSVQSFFSTCYYTGSYCDICPPQMNEFCNHACMVVLSLLHVFPEYNRMHQCNNPINRHSLSLVKVQISVMDFDACKVLLQYRQLIHYKILTFKLSHHALTPNSRIAKFSLATIQQTFSVFSLPLLLLVAHLFTTL